MKVGIIGFGHFGQALGLVLKEASREYRAFDPYTQIPDDVRADSLEVLVQKADLLVVAVPILAVRATMRDLAPYVREDQIVLDVASVKVAPSQAMAEVFGAKIPWVATHPLFGPTSLALGERPLNVIVCPNALHPAAVAKVRAFWLDLGFRVIDQDADAHDRDMAQTHALTYFLAKGMIDIGAGQGVQFAPPSFANVAKTLEAVRSDAGHLFYAMHRNNPYAREVRTRFLKALSEVDSRLNEPHDPLAVEEAEMAIPETREAPPALREARDLIDELDHELVQLLARRMHLSKRAKQAKAGIGQSTWDPKREAQVLKARHDWGRDAGIDDKSIDEIFDAVLRFSRRVQESDGDA